jgi:hypothetical protein
MIIDIIVRAVGVFLSLGVISLLLLAWLNRRHYEDLESSYELDYARLQLLRTHARHRREVFAVPHRLERMAHVRESIPNSEALEELRLTLPAEGESYLH